MLCFPHLQFSPFLSTKPQNPAFPPIKIPSFSLRKCFTFSSFSHFPNRISSGHPRFFLGSYSSLDSSGSTSDDDLEIELDRLLALLPDEMRVRVNEHPELHQLIEVVMDLGRKPLARFPSGDFVLSDSFITVKDLEYATSQVKLATFSFWFGILSLLCYVCVYVTLV